MDRIEPLSALSRLFLLKQVARLGTERHQTPARNLVEFRARQKTSGAPIPSGRNRGCNLDGGRVAHSQSRPTEDVGCMAPSPLARTTFSQPR